VKATSLPAVCTNHDISTTIMYQFVYSVHSLKSLFIVLILVTLVIRLSLQNVYTMANFQLGDGTRYNEIVTRTYVPLRYSWASWS